jgi:phosphoserine phosphatase
MVPKLKGTAAFIRVEGVLLNGGIMGSSAYLAANGQGFTERALRLGQIALTGPVAGMLKHTNGALANQIIYQVFRGMSADRIAVLGQEYFDEVLKPRLRTEAYDLIDRSKRDGHMVVLVSEAIGEVVRSLRGHIPGVDLVASNALVFRNGRATGKLKEPVLGGLHTGKWIERFAREHAVDLASSVAYASRATDQPLLSAVGHPCAVNPDLILRQTARESNWRALEL